MKYLIFSQANELTRVHPDSIAHIKSEGNYSHLTLIDKSKVTFTFNLQHCQQLIDKQLGDDASMFVRVGRQLIVNRNYIATIDLVKQEITLTDSHRRWMFTEKAEQGSAAQPERAVRAVAARPARTPSRQPSAMIFSSADATHPLLARQM